MTSLFLLATSHLIVTTDPYTNGIAPTEVCVWRNRRCHGEVHDENAAGMGGISAHAGLFGTAEDVCKLGETCVCACACVCLRGLQHVYT